MLMLHLGKSLTFKFEFCSVINESKTKSCSNKITLSCVVVFVVIIINNEVRAVRCGSTNVLEAF